MGAMPRDAVECRIEGLLLSRAHLLKSEEVPVKRRQGSNCIRDGVIPMINVSGNKLEWDTSTRIIVVCRESWNHFRNCDKKQTRHIHPITGLRIKNAARVVPAKSSVIAGVRTAAAMVDGLSMLSHRLTTQGRPYERRDKKSNIRKLRPRSTIPWTPLFRRRHAPHLMTGRGAERPAQRSRGPSLDN
jgi:hypothetical protein